MGALSSRPWVGGAELGQWAPPPWPPEHTVGGRVQSYREGGRWANPWMVGRPGVASFFYDWFLAGRDEAAIPRQSELDETLPVRAPVWREDPPFTPSTARMTWLGHATTLAEVDGSTFLCDPVFSSRASLCQLVGPRRYREAACTVAELPRLTAVLISHNHYDHLDLASARRLARLQPWARWFVPAGARQWVIDNTGAPGERVAELEWWEEDQLEGEGGATFTVALTPANHWCKRGIADDNQVLWGSWAVVGPTKRFWFAGDTGYCEAFAQIGKQYGPFDMAAIPIGAYQPNWFMKYQHVHPGEAVQIHRDVRSVQSLGIHWGTFQLTTEYYLEPPVLLTSFMNRAELDPKAFVSTDIGGSVEG